MSIQTKYTVIPLALLLSGLTACANSYRPDSPDVRYKTAGEFQELQLPPDVSGSRDQLYVIPRGQSKIARSSVLPGAESVSFKRDGELGWLEVKVPVEKFWPELVAFVESEGYALAVNDSLAGILVTEWRQPRSITPRTGLMQKIFGDNHNIKRDEFERFVLRLERGDGDTSRLFANFNVYRNVKLVADANKSWEFDNDDENRSAELLTRILTWIGIDEQQASQILSATDVLEIRAGVLLRTNEEKQSYLLIWDDYENAFKKVKKATSIIGFNVSDDDIDTGTIEAEADADYLDELKVEQAKRREENKGFFSGLFRKSSDQGVEIVLRLQRLESRVYALDVLDADTGRLDGEPARRILESIRDALIGQKESVV